MPRSLGETKSERRGETGKAEKGGNSTLSSAFHWRASRHDSPQRLRPAKKGRRNEASVPKDTFIKDESRKKAENHCLRIEEQEWVKIQITPGRNPIRVNAFRLRGSDRVRRKLGRKRRKKLSVNIRKKGKA